MPLSYVLYLIGSLSLILWFYKLEENKGFMTLILFWLFCFPILSSPDYTITIPKIGFDLQPIRLLFLALAPFFLWKLIKRINRHSEQNESWLPKLNGFEVLLIAYIAVSIFAILINNSQIGFRKVIKESTDLITFGLVFFVAKRYISQKDLYLLTKALLIFGTLSAVIGVYQFFVDPEFFRNGSARAAFGSYTRANGLFLSEYDQGIFLVITFIVCWAAFSSFAQRLLMSAVFILGIFVTMHRLSWITMILVFSALLILASRKNLPLLLAGALLASIISLSLTAGLFPELSSNEFINTLITERVQADTLTGRLQQYDFSLKLISKYPLGIGDFGNPLYDREAYVYRLYFHNGNALIVHNGLLSAGVRGGVLGALAFILFILSALFFFIRKSFLFGKQWYLPLAVVLVYALFNTTNDFSYWGTNIAIFLALLLGSLTGNIETRENIVAVASTVGQYPTSFAYQGGKV